MTYSDKSYNLRIELDTKNYECSAEEIERMERALDQLNRLASNFPVSDLYVTIIYHERTGDFHVKTSLILSGRVLFTGERHREMYSAYQQCVDQLASKLDAYKSSLNDSDERAKHAAGTAHDIVPTNLADHDAVQKAIDDRDYVGFRKATLMYEEPLRKRIGRWVQRYPLLDNAIGKRIEIADLVEDVFLTAFERFNDKPFDVPPGQWLEDLIDEVIQDLAAHPIEEMENISLARSAVEAETERPNE